MMRFRLVFAMLLGFGAMVAPSLASNCSVDEYDHNQSLMEVQLCDRTLDISYIQPRPGMVKAGARAGDFVFEGDVSLIGVATGTAYLFSAKCGTIGYQVTGAIRSTSILLEGTAPVRNANCVVTKYRNDELLFTLKIRASLPAPAASDWYVITGSFENRADANTKVWYLNTDGNDDWLIKNTRDCPNFTNRYCIATIGLLSKDKAEEWRKWTKQSDAYIKTCNYGRCSKTSHT